MSLQQNESSVISPHIYIGIHEESSIINRTTIADDSMLATSESEQSAETFPCAIAVTSQMNYEQSITIDSSVLNTGNTGPLNGQIIPTSDFPICIEIVKQYSPGYVCVVNASPQIIDENQYDCCCCNCILLPNCLILTDLCCCISLRTYIREKFCNYSNCRCQRCKCPTCNCGSNNSTTYCCWYSGPSNNTASSDCCCDCKCCDNCNCYADCGDCACDCDCSGC